MKELLGRVIGTWCETPSQTPRVRETSVDEQVEMGEESLNQNIQSRGRPDLRGHCIDRKLVKYFCESKDNRTH